MNFKCELVQLKGQFQLYSASHPNRPEILQRDSFHNAVPAFQTLLNENRVNIWVHDIKLHDISFQMT